METRTEILVKLEELINKDVDVNEILTEVEILKRAFGKTLEEETNKHLENFIAEGGEPSDFSAPKSEDRDKFNDLLSTIHDRKTKKESDIKNTHEQNLKTKQDLVIELQDIIRNEENISKAFNRMSAVKNKWKVTGEVSPHAYKDLQNDYSKLLEEFFYHINIYKELKDNDFKKNLQQREEMIVKMKALVDEKSIKNTRSLSGTYLSEWDEIGPVNRDDWGRVRDEFRIVSKEVFDKIKSHFTEIKEQRKNNLDKKQELLQNVIAIAELDIDNIKTWRKRTDEVLTIQKEWKSTGFAEKKHNDKIWEEFREACNTFFDKKSEFFGGEKEKWNGNKERKEKLIVRAEKLKDLTDWKETSFQMMKLQKNWKNIGPAGQKAEQPLWNKFRKACDSFFNAKKEYYDTLDDRLAENLKKKEAFVIKLGKAKIEKEKGAAQIKTLIGEWDELGMVSRDSMKDVNEKYRKAIDVLYDKLGLDKNAIESQKFNDKIENLKGKDNAEKLLKDEQRFINEQIDKLNKEILQYENNLSFFGFSKGATADKMKAEVQGNIDMVQVKVDAWAQKRKEVSKAVRGLTKPKEGVKEDSKPNTETAIDTH
ncbi:MAG: DUF349 domain-containing protein [Flavobacteriales bacterium]|nr:DUF349 domain-containing protein [Flavobacteriales bacterium]